MKVSRKHILLALAGATAFAGSAGSAAGWPIPMLSRRGPPPAVPMSIPALQAGLRAKSGSDTIYFPRNGAVLDTNAMTTLAAQAQWLLANPTVSVRLEGHGGPLDTRDYALAIGEKRAAAVRDFLVLRGIGPDRLKIVSWGKERPGSMWVGQTVVAVGPRVVTVVESSGGPALLGSR